MSIFKACDIRGVFGDDLTPDLFRRLGRGIALMMGERESVVVGGDFRVSTEELKSALVQGLRENGRAVTDAGLVPTPVVYFAKHRLSSYACAIVTASHNPPQFNGLKFMLDERPVLPEDVARLREYVESDRTDSPTGPMGTVRCAQDIVSAYEEWALDAAGNYLASGPGRPVKVVVDAGNGAFSEIAPRALRAMDGVEVDELFCAPDGRFPNRDPNSALPQHLAALCARVREIGADLGVAFDGDGDRVSFVDESGEALSGDEMFVILMRAAGDRLRGEKIVYDIKCSRVVADEAVRLGAAPLMERSGHAFIKGRMVREGAALGGEVSGHYFYRELHGGDDGLFSAMVGTRLVQGSKRTLGELRRTVPRRFITRDIRLECPRDVAEGLIERLRERFGPEQRNELDGMRVAFPGGWALLRMSITEPKITLRFEGADAASLDAVLAAFLAPLPQIRDKVYAAMREHGDPRP